MKTPQYCPLCHSPLMNVGFGIYKQARKCDFPNNHNGMCVWWGFGGAKWEIAFDQNSGDWKRFNSIREMKSYLKLKAFW